MEKTIDQGARLLQALLLHDKEKTPLEKTRGVSLMLLQKLLNNLIDKLSVCTPFNFRHESAHYFTHLGF